MRVHHYHPETREYLGSGEAQLDPLESKARGDLIYLLPAHAAAPQPPEPAPQQVARWNGEAWELVTDLRGLRYWLPDGSAHEIRALGISPPTDALDAPPPKPEPQPVPESDPPPAPVTRAEFDDLRKQVGELAAALDALDDRVPERKANA